MRYSIAQLVERAQAGRIGRRGLHRLSMAGLDAGELAQSGVSGGVDVEGALGARREGNFLRAIQRAQAATAQGHAVGAATQARLAQAPAGLRGGFSVDAASGALTPATSPEGASTGVTLTQLLEDYRKRRPNTLSDAGVYDL